MPTESVHTTPAQKPINRTTPPIKTQPAHPEVHDESSVKLGASFMPSPSDSPGPRDLTPGNTLASPKIKFVFHDINGKPDFKNAISGIRDLSLSDFFALYAHKSGFRLPELEYLTFVVIFAGRAELEVTQWDSDEDWQNFKRKVTNLFLVARKRNPMEREFEVWVMKTNKTATADIEEDEFAGL
jgi:hypothetical protein